MTKSPEAFFAQVAREFPSKDFLTRDPEQLQIFGRDWTRWVEPHPLAVVFPRSGAEVARFLKLCSLHCIAVVPSGGRTGLAAGAVAANGEIVLSLSKMQAMGSVDTMARTVRVQAGAITEAVHAHCAPHGLTWPVDFASKGSSQVGGNIATNAGGVRVIRWGLTRNWVLGLQVATMRGELLELNGALEKNNTGLDLRQLFIGTEGTLGVITEATLRLAPLEREAQVLFFGLRDLAQVFALFERARRAEAFQLQAFEVLDRACLSKVTQARGLRPPFDPASVSHAVLVEANRLDEDWLTALFEDGIVQEGVAAKSPEEARTLWEMREGVAEALMHDAKPHKNDIALPIAELPAFLRELEALFAQEHAETLLYIFGHIGDGNLHINQLPALGVSTEDFLDACHRSDAALFGLVKKYRGSISAEHGIGLLKKDALHFSRTPEEMAYLRAVKRVFDPDELLNPGKIFDLEPAAPGNADAQV